MLTKIKNLKKFKIPAKPSKKTKCHLCKKSNFNQDDHCKLAALVIDAGYLEIEWDWLCGDCYWKVDKMLDKLRKEKRRNYD